MNTIFLNGTKCWISEKETDPDALFCKFIICDFNPNLNGVQLDRSTIENWYGTLKNSPLVGKIVAKYDGSKDFTGHNARVVKRKKCGAEYEAVEFDTSAFGTFVDVQIEEIEGSEYIVATAKVWKRFNDAATILEERAANGGVKTSWEVAVEESEAKIVDGSPVKVIKAGRFLSHCLLGKDVDPAYPCSELLEVASKESEDDLLAAIVRDVIFTSEVFAPTIETPDVSEPEKSEAEIASITYRDLIDRLYQAINTGDEWYDIMSCFPEEHAIWCHRWPHESELDVYIFTYEVDEAENVVVSEPTYAKLTVSVSQYETKFAELNEALVSANRQIAELKPYQDQVEAEAEAQRKIERDNQVSALKAYVVDSQQFTDDEIASDEISALINELNKDKLNALIAERFIFKARKNKPAETSEAKPANVVKPVLEVDDIVDKINSMREFLRK